MKPAVAKELRARAKTWGSGAGISGYPGGGRAPVLSEYLRHLMRVDWGLEARARDARGKREVKRTVKIARSVARWAPRPHPWSANSPVQGYRQALLVEWPNQADATLRQIGRDGLALGIVAAIAEGETLDPLEVTPQELHRFAFVRAADAGRRA